MGSARTIVRSWATGSLDYSVRLWDPRAGGPLGAPLTGHTSLVAWGAGARLDDCPVLATGDIDRVVRLWDLRASSPVSALLGFGIPGHTKARDQDRFATIETL
jgi:WD40 repeat protein